jgi:hypothetical protein
MRGLAASLELSVAHLPRRWRWLVVALFILAGLALAAQFLVYVHYAIALLRFPFDYDQGEGFELYDTVLQARGVLPYLNSQVFPFYTSIYPPLFHWLTVPLVWLFGPQLWTGRLVGFTASLVTAAAIGWGVHRAAGHKVIAAFAGLTFLASNYTFHIGPLFRQHMTMVMFETLAIVALANLTRPAAPSAAPGAPAQKTERWGWGFWLGMLFLLAAGYTKPLSLPTAVAGFAFLFLRGPRRSLLAGLGLAAVAGALFIALNVATSGWWTISIVRANLNSFDTGQAISLYRQWGELHLIILAAALARLVYEIYGTRLSAYSVWLVCAVANGVSAGKFGAGESYFVTATAAACILSGIGFAALWQRAARWARPLAVSVALAIPLLYVAQTRLTLHMYTTGPVYSVAARLLGVSSDSGYYDSQGYTQLGPRPTAADHAAGDEIVRLAQTLSPNQPVFSEEAGFMFRAGKPVVTNPFPQLVMYQAGLFDPTQEIAMINAQAFGLVILRGPPQPEPAIVGFYPPPVLAALGNHYQLKTEIGMNGFLYRILVPKP